MSVLLSHINRAIVDFQATASVATMALMGCPSTPTVYLPLSLRGGLRLRSLREHRFSLEEKRWTCTHIVNLCDDVTTDLVTVATLFCAPYCMEYSTVVHWVLCYLNGDELTDPRCPLDRAGLAAVMDAVGNGPTSGETEAGYEARLCLVLKAELDAILLS